ncbi:MAG: hypothetical protein HYR66_09225 [Sphingobacteriales bacterium]|nr:hypothetical protein [Sphingobacteriales bacterium]MBI3718337.1 hypothetical protein [Sphingobacteriales bacterium]
MDYINLRNKNQLSYDNLLMVKVFPFVWLAFAGVMAYLSGFIGLIFLVPMSLFVILWLPKSFSAVDVFVNYEKNYFELKNLNEKITRKDFHNLKYYTKSYGRLITLHFNDNSRYCFVTIIYGGSRTRHSKIVLKILDRIIENNKAIIT